MSGATVPPWAARIGLSTAVAHAIEHLTLEAWADFYLSVGLRPLPRRAGSKHPGVRWGEFQHRAPCADEIHRWFTSRDVSGICTVLDQTGYAVLEVDAAPGRLREGVALLEAHGITRPPACPTVISGSGRSAQFWFRSDRVTGRHVAAIVHADGPAKAGGAQVDILAAGIVVLPPTPHRDTGKPYRWRPPLQWREHVPELP